MRSRKYIREKYPGRSGSRPTEYPGDLFHCKTSTLSGKLYQLVRDCPIDGKLLVCMRFYFNLLVVLRTHCNGRKAVFETEIWLEVPALGRCSPSVYPQHLTI